MKAKIMKKATNSMKENTERRKNELRAFIVATVGCGAYGPIGLYMGYE